jgi:hypothetical protein
MPNDPTPESTPDRCNSCHGTGEAATENGMASCPDCGGAGYLPSPHVRVEWRARDIELAHASGATPVARDVRFLLAELRRSRDALMEIASLAQELDENAVVSRLRFTVMRALRLYEVVQNEAPAKKG